MNFLQLCQKLRSEASIPGTGPTTVIGQTGQLKRIVEWIQEAYESIQNEHKMWEFLQGDVSFNTIIGQAEYTQTSAGLTDMLTWKTDDFRIYESVSDESFLFYEPWQTFRLAYQFGSMRLQTAKPTVITVKPNNSIVLWPIPNSNTATVDGQYYKEPDVMSADLDVPVFQSNFHMAIVWKALMFYGADLGAPDVYAHGYEEYKKALKKMERQYLPEPVFGNPLA